MRKCGILGKKYQLQLQICMSPGSLRELATLRPTLPIPPPDESWLHCLVQPFPGTFTTTNVFKCATTAVLHVIYQWNAGVNPEYTTDGTPFPHRPGWSCLAPRHFFSQRNERFDEGEQHSAGMLVRGRELDNY